MIPSENLEKIIIVDFGSQFTQLIARRIRELGVFSEIISHKKIKEKKILKKNISGFILSGGPLNVHQIDKYNFNKKILQLKIPVLGICFGHQILSKELGGKVKKSNYREFGLAELKKINNSLLVKNFFNKKNISKVWMSHADQVSKMPKEFKIIASSKNSKLAIIENVKKKIYGVQFHPEVTHTNKGKILLRNFLFLICKIKKNWTSKDQKKKLIKDIKKQVGVNKVICGLSGGVDSSVVAQLLSKAIGKNLICVFVNNGLLRKNEEVQVVNIFKKKLKIKLIYVNAQQEFIKSLKNIPGIYSARLAKKHGSFFKAMKFILKKMKKKKNRKATFVCSLSYKKSGGKIISVEGKLDGNISRKIIGKRGFGYDPIFIPLKENITLGQMYKSKKVKMDHRFLAFMKLKKKIKI